MTKREAIKMQRRMERDGWADVQIMISAAGLRRVTYGVSATDPVSGYQSPWLWQYEAVAE